MLSPKVRPAPAARDILASEGAATVATEFSVMASTPAEQIELSADRGLLGVMADWTGGVLVEEPQIAEAALRMGPSELLRPPQRKEYVLWNHWPLLVFILIAATAEWLLRKKAGLA